MHHTKNDIIEKQALLAIKEKYMSLLNHNTDSVFLIDERGMIQYANAVATKALGYDLEKLLHQPIEQFIESNSLSNFQLMIKQTMSGYPAELQKCLFQHDEWSLYYVYLKAIPIYNQGNVKDFI